MRYLKTSSDWVYLSRIFSLKTASPLSLMISTMYKPCEKPSKSMGMLSEFTGTLNINGPSWLWMVTTELPVKSYPLD